MIVNDGGSTLPLFTASKPPILRASIFFIQNFNFRTGQLSHHFNFFGRCRYLNMLPVHSRVAAAAGGIYYNVEVIDYCILNTRRKNINGIQCIQLFRRVFLVFQKLVVSQRHTFSKSEDFFRLFVNINRYHTMQFVIIDHA